MEFWGDFDPTDKEQRETAMTSVNGISLGTKNALRLWCLLTFRLYLVFILFFSSQETQCHFSACIIDSNVAITEREKLPNLLKKIDNTVD